MNDSNRETDEDKLEKEAAALWRRENPDMSVFECDPAMKELYRDRIRRIAALENENKAAPTPSNATPTRGN